MKKMDHCIHSAHRHGIRIVPYFSVKEMHPEADGYAENVLKIIEESDAIRRPQRLKSVLNLAHVIYTTDTELWLTALEHIKKMDSAKIAASCSDKSMIGHALHCARLRIIEELV